MAVLIVLVIITIGWCIYHYVTTGEFPDAFAQRIYTSSKNLFVAPKSAIELFDKTSGHHMDAVAKEILENGDKDEKMYREQIRRGKISNSGMAAAIDNTYAMGQIATHFLDQTPENAQAAAALRTETLVRIAMRPAAAIAAQVPPENIIVAWEADPQVQAMLLTEVRRARQLEARPDEPGYHERYYEARRVVSDPQNVHDSEVQTDARRILRQIQQKNAAEFQRAAHYPVDNSIAGMRQWLEDRAYDNPAMKNNALTVFNAMAQGAENTGLQTNERQLLHDVWMRANSAENHQNRHNVHDALVSALADSAVNSPGIIGGNTTTVCVTGRCTRLLGAFTHIDADQTIAEPIKTIDILRNEILSKSHNILTKELESNSLMDRYNGGETSPELDIALENVRDSIKQLGSGYHEQNPVVVEQCIQDALAGV